MKKLLAVILLAITLGSCVSSYIPCPAFANSTQNNGCGYTYTK
jgi:hypothetical protein